MDVATATDPSDGNRPARRPSIPESALAGEVRKKKLRLQAEIVPPPPSLRSDVPRQLDHYQWRQAEANSLDDEEGYTTRRLPNPHPPEPTVLASPPQASRAQLESSESSQALKRSEYGSKIDFIRDYPHMAPYLRYNLNLERRNDDSSELPHTE